MESLISPTHRPLPMGIYSSPTLGKFFEALSKAQAEFGIAVFDSENPHFRNKFASLKSIDEATKKALSKNGISTTQIVYSGTEGPRLLTILGHSSGEFMGGDLKLILAKGDMQGLGSATTYGKRYAKAAMLGVVSDADDDGEAAVGRNHSETQRDNPHQVMPEEATFEPPKVDHRRQQARKLATSSQINMLKAKAGAAGLSLDDLSAISRNICGETDLRELAFSDVNKAIQAIESFSQGH